MGARVAGVWSGFVWPSPSSGLGTVTVTTWWVTSDESEQNMNVANWRVVLTGHSRGLGAALARALRARGISVLGLSRQALTGVSGQQAAQLTEVALDLSDVSAVEAWLASGRLGAWLAGAEHTLLVNNAGTVAPIGAAGGLQPGTSGQVGMGPLARAIALNVTTPLLLTDAFVAATRGRADRRVAHVSSGAARNPYPGWSTYCATKAALDMHARATQLDAVPGLRVASVAPGVIDTDMQADIRAASAADFPMHARFVAMKQDGQLTAADDAAQRLVAYILSDAFGSDPTPDIRQVSV